MGGEEKQIPRDGGSVKELPYPASVGAVLGLTPSQDVPSVKTDSEFIDEAYPGFRFPNSGKSGVNRGPASPWAIIVPPYGLAARRETA